jgi:hypothetical protein
MHPRFCLCVGPGRNDASERQDRAMIRSIAPLVVALVLSVALGALAQGFTSKDRSDVIHAVHQVVPASAAVRVVGATQGYARASVTMQGTDPATVYCRKRNGRWRVIAGPGTSWSAGELARLGIPRSLR